MQNKAKQTKPVQLVRKPIIPGSWHGRDAWKLAFKRMLSFIGITLLYVIAGALLSFNSLWARVAMAVLIVGGTLYYQVGVGMSRGQSDAAFGEILYSRRESGKNVPASECERSFHRFKGLFAVLVGCLPFVLFAIVFACVTQKTVYRLGTLPSWTESLMLQTEFGTGLAYYTHQPGVSAVDVMRIIDRAMIMPFVNVAISFGADATLLAERLSPLLILITPLGYALGYMQGLNERARINTGIKMGDDKKKRREKKARKQRQRSKAPERLI